MADGDSTPGKSPAFQFYPKDFLTSEHVELMSLAERGAYITLICKCWIEGSLPSNVDQLARLCGTPAAAFRKLWPAMEPCFRQQGNTDRLVHPRLERERRKQREYRRKQADNGRLGGRPKKPSLSITKPVGFSGESQTEPKKRSAFALSDLQSSSPDSRQQQPQPTNARSKHPVYTSDRFAVFEWQFDELSKMLGAHFEGFALDEFFDRLTQESRASGLVIPKSEAWGWLQAQVLAEAQRRGLPMASTEPVRDKAAERRAQDERILAMIQQDGRHAGR